jgi:ATP-binding cassette, subfamily B (MDR/TAP), member 1
MKRILRQPKAWFDKPENAPGRITECLDRNAEETRNLVGRFLPVLIMAVSMILISVAWAMFVSWKLTLVALAGWPVVLASTKAFSAMGTRWEARCNVGAENASAVMAEALTNIRVVRALALESHFAAKHRKSTLSTLHLGLKRARYGSPFYGLYQSMNYFLTALVYYYGAVLLVQNQGISASTIVQVVNLLLLGMGTATAILSAMPQISAARAAALQLLHYANLAEHPSHESRGRKKITTPFPIQMNDLAFSYPSRPQIPILRGLSLQIQAGTCTAIAGPSGCGKSTIASLLLGLYEASPAKDEGLRQSLTFAGVAASDVDFQHFRHMTAFVPQAAVLFPTTMLENIAYGVDEASPLRTAANIESAAREAGIHDFIVSLPDGYDTLVGDGGQAVSGGQAQRLCIARALARRPRLLVMDEPTSALDAESADMVRTTIGDLMVRGAARSSAGRAAVIITHSREMMRIADTIIVIEDGRVSEEGRFDELWRRKGRFAQLVSGRQCLVDGISPESTIKGKE